VLFVPFAAPGRPLGVEIELRPVRPRAHRRVGAAPHRRAPRCRHFGDCGGCQFQHVDYATQVASKAEFVRDALVRTGGFDWPEPVVVHAAGEWGYRMRTQLKVHGRQVGFHRPGSNELVEVEECPVMAPDLEQGLPAVRAALQALPPPERVHQIDGACGTDGASWAPELPGLEDLVEQQVLGHRYLIEPESFFQGNRLLVAALVQGALGDHRGELAFDLYAGVGLFALPLAERFTRVIAVEDERRAATLGRVNVKQQGAGNVSYFRQTTEAFLRQNRQRPDLVLMDPPRLGAGAAAAAGVGGASAGLRLVSDPHVSARSAPLRRRLRTAAVQGYMFLQTWHAECVAPATAGQPHDRNPPDPLRASRGAPDRHGPLALLVHGYPLDHRMWLDALQGPLAAQRTLVAVDLRGHGARPGRASVHRMTMFADDLAAWSARWRQPDVVGLSKAATVLALRNCTGLLRCWRWSTRAPPPTRPRARPRAGDDQERGRTRPAGSPSSCCRSAAPDPEPLVAARLQSMIEHAGRDDRRRPAGMRERKNCRGVLAQVAVPALVVVGEHDALTPPAEAESMAKAIPGARLVVVPGAGHLTPLERPDAFVQELTGFWQG
jgi:23S rRNA (uracil1939-C5)-methyltransferase